MFQATMSDVTLSSNANRASSTTAVLPLFTSRQQASNLLLFAYEARALTRLSYAGMRTHGPEPVIRSTAVHGPCYIGWGLRDFDR